MTRSLLCLVFLSMFASLASAQNRQAKSVLERYADFRPDADALAMYRLDWAESLDEARKRAAREKRPVLLVVIHAKYGDLASGHC